MGKSNQNIKNFDFESSFESGKIKSIGEKLIY